ncbi:MAG: DUF502 domain-containing protein [Candidatus Zixiibacteriota bacterium]|nr:MAG: DUF502 domain-containing protein [candidate division Zixibacteria bacterium]
MSSSNSIVDIIKRYFIGGVLVVVPAILTFLVLQFLFEAVDGILATYLHDILGYYRTGLGVLTIVLLIMLCGVLTRNFLGRRIYEAGDRLLVRVPLIRPIYSAAKQLLQAMTTAQDGSFKEVGLVEYPRRGAYQLCFVSRRLTLNIDGEQRRFASVFVPSTPTPVSGMVVLVPAHEIMLLDMTVEDGIKFLVSGGVASPSLLTSRRPAEPVSAER